MEVRTGIPTRHQHCQFRSRLEAKWAAFYDLCGWKWEYEPFDLKGWIPDFLLIGKKKEILVEVKPYVRFEQFKEAAEKIISATSMGVEQEGREPSEILLLGCCFPQGEYGDRVALGWFLGYDPIVTGICNDLAIFNKGFRGDTCTQIGFRADCGYYVDRITGEYDSHPIEPEIEEVETLWRMAGNNVQWTPTKETQP